MFFSIVFQKSVNGFENSIVVFKNREMKTVSVVQFVPTLLNIGHIFSTFSPQYLLKQFVYLVSGIYIIFSNFDSRWRNFEIHFGLTNFFSIFRLEKGPFSSKSLSRVLLLKTKQRELFKLKLCTYYAQPHSRTQGRGREPMALLMTASALRKLKKN